MLFSHLPEHDLLLAMSSRVYPEAHSSHSAFSVAASMFPHSLQFSKAAVPQSVKEWNGQYIGNSLAVLLLSGIPHDVIAYGIINDSTMVNISLDKNCMVYPPTHVRASAARA